MAKRITSTQNLKITIELNNGEKVSFYKSSKWTLSRVSSFFERKYDGQWHSVEVKVI